MISHAAMNNIQDEIDLVGESAPVLTPMPPPIPQSAFAVLSEYFFSAPELFRASLPGPVAAFLPLFTARDPLARRRENGLQDEAIGALFTKTTC